MKTVIFFLSSFFIFCVSVSAQSLLGKSQILIAYKSKTAFLGEVVYIGNLSDGGFSTGIGFSQTAIFKVKKQLKGGLEDEFVKISFDVTRGDNLNGLIFRGNDYVVFLSENSGNGDSSFCGNFERGSKTGKFKVAKNDKPFKVPCYSATLRSLVAGTKEELEAITDYLSFLKNKNKN
ncbi:MAG: hypothetical protein R2682_12950 [Pyrinomonadaceae bacterium]